MARSSLEKSLAPGVRMEKVEARLSQEFRDAKCSLDFKNPFELMVATILSAQCTDERVNKVTPALFAVYPDAHSMAKAKAKDLQALIRSTGFYNSKSKSILSASQSLVSDFGGGVPRTIEELTQLRGVGRKTANVILGNAYKIHLGIAVDTHVGRLARRLGFSKNADPVKVEQDLMKLVKPESRTQISHLLIYHGRKTCSARKALCGQCLLSDLCPKVGIGKT